MTKEQAITTVKQFRKDADELLQRMKEFEKCICRSMIKCNGADMPEEVARQHSIAIMELEGAIMRQGMVLKYIGSPNPYPNSKDPTNTIVEPTADGLKL